MMNLGKCWVCEKKRAVTIHEGHPICGDCMDHFTAPASRKGDYTDSATANDMRFGCDSDYGDR